MHRMAARGDSITKCLSCVIARLENEKIPVRNANRSVRPPMFVRLIVHGPRTTLGALQTSRTKCRGGIIRGTIWYRRPFRRNAAPRQNGTSSTSRHCSLDSMNPVVLRCHFPCSQPCKINFQKKFTFLWHILLRECHEAINFQ
jgi:hypothetical protein